MITPRRSDNAPDDPGPALDSGDGARGLDVRDLVVRYRARTALDIPRLSFRPGITALTGSNGSGKTTLLKVCALLLRPAAGSVSLGNRGPDPDKRANLRRHREAIGYLPQAPDFPGHFTVHEAVTYAAWLRSVPRARRAETVRRVIDDLNLTEVTEARLRSLSGGNRQRAHIAQAVVHEPAVLLLDEPTTGIDVEHRMELRTYLARLGRTRCVVLSTHHTEDIELLADRVVSLREGRIVFDGTPAELTARADGGTDDGARSVERALNALSSGGNSRQDADGGAR
ncbi:ATP-binding cassette domain-containing protein [Streptomyces yangpuensis]|uniref:ATP-binding cassette domain-containing protein n=1 Tax=Streptomyces yangpuensis TaxID=1648182 RepID=A0ABY5Q0D4_9ACTN|nr:ATP-binding cassette domain-containing protein [Streptomyces yangpuensis]MBZ9598095.1 ATP-binding cassette domain-containing protein [Streptomyces erythrochromogenes]UUY49896.1 ATP-binding cassette domain-containing protein [Streptomyces yangpuensis]